MDGQEMEAAPVGGCDVNPWSVCTGPHAKVEGTHPYDDTGSAESADTERNLAKRLLIIYVQM